MSLNKIFPLIIFLASISIASAQKISIVPLQSGSKKSIRGLSVVNDQVIWVSGNNGTVGRSVDGGKNVEWTKVKGYEKTDFRDIEAFDEQTAIIMGIAEPGIILKTKDAGMSWQLVFRDTAKGMFLDAMHFMDDQRGIVIGDPLQQQVYLAATIDGGESWVKTSSGFQPNLQVNEGEAFFASSGTNIHLGNEIVFVSGGKSSRLFYGKQKLVLPLVQGKESTGANSIAIFKNKKGVIVGGDFSKDTISLGNAAMFNVEKDIKFSIPKTAPHGYRSCVIYIDQNKLITCGTSGVDISKDGGNNWTLISTVGYHVVQKAKKGNTVFLAGGDGRIAKLVW
jgi:hypothetical protein